MHVLFNLVVKHSPVFFFFFSPCFWEKTRTKYQSVHNEHNKSLFICGPLHHCFWNEEFFPRFVLFWGPVRGVYMSPVWISNLSTSQFQKVRMLLSEFRPVACRSLSFQLFHGAVSEPCCLSEFTLTGPLFFKDSGTFEGKMLHILQLNGHMHKVTHRLTS